jgi:hypothetical protein
MRSIGLVVGHGDPVAVVTGVSADAILERCTEIRARRVTGAEFDEPTGARGSQPMSRTTPPARRFVELIQLSDADFVVQAHERLLGRSPRTVELTRRTEQLGAGKTRFEIVGRLVLSKEGRTAPLPDVGGLVLPVLVRTARMLERSGLWAMLDRSRFWAVRDWLSAFRQLGSLRREVVTLRREVVVLREEVRALRQERRT